MTLEGNELVPTTVQADMAKPDWRALFIFNFYRLTVAIVFVISVSGHFSPSFLGQFDKKLFLVTSLLYSGFAIFCIFSIKKKWLSFNVQVLGQFLLDIFAITLLMHASGGVNSGLGLLFVIAIAGGSLLSEGRIAFFLAAIASLCVLFHVALADIYNWFLYQSYTHAGMLGVTFFVTAFLVHTLAHRVRASEALAKQRGDYLRYLAELNAQIVQNIQSGIVVIDIVSRISLFNETARRLLGLEEQPNGRTLSAVAPELAEQLKNWKNKGQVLSPLFRPAVGEVDVIATFKELKRGDAATVLIMLEDATLTAQRVQQLKLASLGRLTASIAHEIRNPLGAISHAGQLLAESPELSKEDARLTQIIANNSQRVNTIIENVLQLSRRKEADTECFDLQVYLKTYCDDFLMEQNLNKSDVILHTYHTALMVYFDQQQLYQVLYNLCENGLRYSQGSPLLELTASINEESNRPYLEVLDHGKGMTEEVKAQIFEPFFTTESKGTGLGLYITREICEANKASLHLVSSANTGCCFRIYFSSCLSG
jgi:two-component system sensor histidine kinase PilS (NtrC family)